MPVEGCLFPKCWYDDFSGYAVSSTNLLHVPTNPNDPDPSATPYRCNPLTSQGGAFIPSCNLEVITGDLAKLRPRYSDGSSGLLNMRKHFSAGDQSAFLGSTYADRNSMTYEITDWFKDTDPTTVHEITLSSYFENQFKITETNSNVFSGAVVITSADDFLQDNIPFTLTGGIEQAFTLNFWDGVDEGDYGGATGVTLSSFEWEFQVAGVVVVESLTGETRNHPRMLVGSSNWCSEISAILSCNNNAGATYTLDRIEAFTAADASCLP